jgi:hypothetical protein
MEILVKNFVFDKFLKKFFLSFLPVNYRFYDLDFQVQLIAYASSLNPHASI